MCCIFSMSLEIIITLTCPGPEGTLGSKVCCSSRSKGWCVDYKARRSCKDHLMPQFCWDQYYVPYLTILIKVFGSLPMQRVLMVIAFDNLWKQHKKKKTKVCFCSSATELLKSLSVSSLTLLYLHFKIQMDLCLLT